MTTKNSGFKTNVKRLFTTHSARDLGKVHDDKNGAHDDVGEEGTVKVTAPT